MNLTKDAKETPLAWFPPGNTAFVVFKAIHPRVILRGGGGNLTGSAINFCFTPFSIPKLPGRHRPDIEIFDNWYLGFSFFNVLLMI